MIKVKTIISAFLSLMLILSTMGISMSSHYCMGRLKDVAFFDAPKSCVPADDQGCLPECCKDEHQIFKVDDLKVSTVDFVLKKCGAPQTVYFGLPHVQNVSQLVNILCHMEASGALISRSYLSLTILFQVFRI